MTKKLKRGRKTKNYVGLIAGDFKVTSRPDPDHLNVVCIHCGKKSVMLRNYFNASCKTQPQCKTCHPKLLQVNTRILKIVADNPGLSQTQMAKMMNPRVRRQRVEQLCKKAASLGYIKQKKIYELTGKGIKMLERVETNVKKDGD
jgi:hypothetical protein